MWTASQNARTMNGRYVSPNPSSARKRVAVGAPHLLDAARSRPRPRWPRARSIALDRTMCSAVRRRMLSNGIRSSPVTTRGEVTAGPTTRCRRARHRDAGRAAGRRLDVAAGDPASLAGADDRRGSRPRSAIMRRTSGRRHAAGGRRAPDAGARPGADAARSEVPPVRPPVRAPVVARRQAARSVAGRQAARSVAPRDRGGSSPGPVARASVRAPLQPVGEAWRAGGVTDHGEAHADVDGVALGDDDLGQHARHR